MVYQFFKFFYRDLLFLDERGYSREIGVIEVVLDHKQFGNSYQYYPLVSEAEYGRSSISGVIKNYFNNSYLSAVSSFVKEEKISVEELKELIDQIENQND